MQLIKTEHYEAYYLEDIKAELGERYEEFTKWLTGQTCPMHEGKPAVYRWDYERFLEGRPVDD
jgi:hypothetical protein